MDSTSETPRSLDDLLEPGSTLMVGTRARSETDLEFRPLTVARVADDQIQVLLDTNEQWVVDLVEPAPVEVTFSDNRSNDWAHLRGTATLTHDPGLIDELWNPFADAYFEEGRDTAGIAVLQVRADSGRYWSSPSGRVGSLIATVKAKVSGPEAAGDHGPITS